MKTLYKSYKAMLPANNQLKKLEADGKQCIIEPEGELFNLYTITEDNTMTTQTDNQTTTADAAANTQTAENVQNGVKRPDADSKAGHIWTLADELSTASPVSFNHLIKEAVARDMNPSTAFTEYTKWRKFHGITGTIIDPEVAAVREAKKKEREAKKQQREANKVARVEQNGITKPAPGSKSAELWALADEMSAVKGAPVDAKDFIAKAESLGHNRNTAQRESYNWRKFYGLVKERELTLEQLQTKLAAAEAEVEKLKTQIKEKVEASAETSPPAVS